MMRADLATSGIAAAIVEARADAALNRLDDFLVFHLDLVQVRAHALLAQRFVPYVRDERYSRARRTEWIHDVERKSPRVEVQHDVGEQPEIERSHSLAVVRMI